MLTRLKTIRAVCCPPGVWAAHLERCEKHFASVSEKYIGGEVKRDILGDAIPRMEIIGETAIIPVRGVLAARLPSIAAAFGYVDPEDIDDELDEAMANESVKSIWLDVDSPGGSVTGIPELAAKVAAIQSGNQKPIRVFARDCYSAALWISAGATNIISLGSGGIGSVGIYTVLADSTGFLASMGITMTRIASGVYKGLGVDGKVSETMITETQSEVNAIAADFKSHIKAFRSVADEDMHGQCFSGKIGAEKGFCDGTADSLESAMKLFAK